MLKTQFKVHKMDCPSEEALVRMQLSEVPEVKHLEFDLTNRMLHVFHTGRIDAIERRLHDLRLGEERLSTAQARLGQTQEQRSQRRLLWTVLGINFSFFLLELATGVLSRSMGLVADSLDMLADSLVYAMSLFAVGGSMARKKRISTLAGYLQMGLAVLGFSEVVRRFIGVAEIPDFGTMIGISALALIANAVCLVILHRSKSQEAHMRASMIFTSNDVMINLGVIVAGVLVIWLNSNKPDLIVGAIVFALVIQGAIRILKLAK